MQAAAFKQFGDTTQTVMSQIVPVLNSLPVTTKKVVTDALKAIPLIIKESIEAQYSMNKREFLGFSDKTVFQKTVQKKVNFNDNTPLKSHLTYAEIMSASLTNTESIRNINLLGSVEVQKHTLSLLRNDHICAEDGISDIKQKESANLTVICVNPDSANNVGKVLSSKYKDVIKISKVNTVKPQIKLVRVPVGNVNFDYKSLIIEHNR